METAESDIPGSIPTEEWRAVPGWEGFYSVSNLGRVYSHPRLIFCQYPDGVRRRLNPGKMMKPRPCPLGYTSVILQRGNEAVCSTQKVHRLVAMAFIPNPDNLPQINHKNGKPGDNRVENLEWCTAEENIHHAVRELGMNQGERSGHAKLTASLVTQIRQWAANGLSESQISMLVPVSRAQVGRIVRRERWQHLP